MIGGFTTTTALSMKKEIVVVMVTISVLLFMPIAAVVSITDVSELTSSEDAKLYTGNASTNNTYDFGYCTFWAAKRREEVGRPIPNTWGNAHTWDDRAKLDHYVVDHTPSLYAIMETDSGDLGHVAFVESVGMDGSWTISEMNAKGWDIMSKRTFLPSEALLYNFIH